MWSIKGRKDIGEVSGKRFARSSFIDGLRANQVDAPLCFNGTCDTVLFNFWLAYCLSPTQFAF
ncbi:hypothetical protein OQJ13_05185 [Legionella sp. PATHC035]|uniref:hypothetical protein n=1 Tax=Legionella sp. PATHC035 TaxID=2992040 RepID=UPI00224467B3|nr:hypothetical protein [Legionella sp. PATHC035]MCW8408361.1 hypothetical protein [Legionella sp. PATHC035]